MLTTLLSSKEIYRATCKITFQESKKPFIDIFIFALQSTTPLIHNLADNQKQNFKLLCPSLYKGAQQDVIVLLSTIRSIFLVVQIRLLEIVPVLIPLITTSTTTIYNTSTREYQYSLNCSSTINLKNQSKVNFCKSLKYFDASHQLKKKKNSRQGRS